MFCDRLRQLRQERHLTQAVLAAQLHVTFQYISLLGHDARLLSLKTMQALARAFEVPLGTLLADERTGQEAGIRWPDLLARIGTSVTGRAHIEERGRSHITSFAVQVAEVSVDPETGEVKLLRFTTAHDVGQIVNPIGHQGQIEGAIMQGIGYALTEELQLEDGRVTNPSFGEYKLPTMPDTPPLTTVLVPSPNGVGPYQIKGIGESPLTPVAPAIANAVADAIGVRIRDLPITAEKVYRALKDKAHG